MINERKNLRDYSYVLLFFTAVTLLMAILNATVGGSLIVDATTQIPEGFTKEIVQIITITVFVVSLILILPYIYVALMGLKNAKNPTSAGGYIVVAKILFVFSAISTISSVSSIFNSTNLFSDLIHLVDTLLTTVVLVIFIRLATAVRKSAN